VRKGAGPRVMAVLWNSIIELDSFSGKASLAAANRQDMCRPEKSVELPSTLARFARALHTAIKKGRGAHTFSPREKVPRRGG